MTAGSRCHAYIVCGKKDTDKPEPTVSRERLQKIQRLMAAYGGVLSHIGKP